MANRTRETTWSELTRGYRSGFSTSPWMESAESPELSPLKTDLDTDVCVIGAGISGLTTAYLLLLAGRKVVVIDDGPIGGGETGRTTAHLTNALDDRYSNLASWRGADNAKLAAESHTAAISLVESIVRSEQIDCDFERLPGYLFQPDGDHTEKLVEELDASRHAGLAGVRLVDRAPWKEFDTGRCLVFPDQAEFHPLRYLNGLARAIQRLGGTIHTGTRVVQIDGEDPVRLETGGPHITAREVVHATNAPLDAPAGIYLKEFPYRTYVIAASIPKGSVAAGLYWDNDDPYHYVRLQKTDAEDLLIVGGEDHPTGKADNADERYGRLEEWTRKRFSRLGEVRYVWSGQVLEPVDGLALIGPYLDRPHQYIITGDSGNGMTHGTLGARLVSDLILGKVNRWATAYDPMRIPKNVRQFVEMGVPAASSYARRVTVGKPEGMVDVGLFEGEIVLEDGKQVAVSRDASGREHRVLAACTHRGCIVAWNSAEMTWDCPCHGSRFAPNGELLTGPAMTPLKSVRKSEAAKPAERPKPAAAPNAANAANAPNGKPAERRPAASGVKRN
ncbi:MAG: FAD-dependent oxidoreductase [Candidatus Eiseniibacteriota bacterium]